MIIEGYSIRDIYECLEEVTDSSLECLFKHPGDTPGNELWAHCAKRLLNIRKARHDEQWNSWLDEGWDDVNEENDSQSDYTDEFLIEGPEPWEDTGDETDIHWKDDHY